MVDTKKKDIRKEGKIKGFNTLQDKNKWASSNFMFFHLNQFYSRQKKTILFNWQFSVFFENHFLDKN